MTHALHDTLYGYSDQHILHPGCHECERRTNPIYMQSLDFHNFSILWNEMLARDWGIGERSGRELSSLDGLVMDHMYVWSLMMEKHFGRKPEGDKPFPVPDAARLDLAMQELEQERAQVRTMAENARAQLEQAREQARNIRQDAKDDAEDARLELKRELAATRREHDLWREAKRQEVLTVNVELEAVVGLAKEVRKAAELDDPMLVADALDELLVAAKRIEEI
jgi:hypothetical protein